MQSHGAPDAYSFPTSRAGKSSAPDSLQDPWQHAKGSLCQSLGARSRRTLLRKQDDSTHHPVPLLRSLQLRLLSSIWILISYNGFGQQSLILYEETLMTTAVSHPPCIQAANFFHSPFQDLNQNNPVSPLFTLTYSSQACSFLLFLWERPRTGLGCGFKQQLGGMNEHGFCNYWSDPSLCPESHFWATLCKSCPAQLQLNSAWKNIHSLHHLSMFIVF